MSDPASPEAPAVHRRHWLRRGLVLLAVVLLGAGAWWWWHHREAGGSAGAGAGGGGRMRGGGGPVTVTAAAAKADDLRIERTALGTVASLSTVTIRTQVSGRLERLAFTEGQAVAAGDLLAQIDDRPFALSLAQYEGQMARDAAQMRQAEQDLARYRTLVEQDSLAHQQLDAQESLVNQIRGTVASDQAQIDATRLNIAYCRITAPCAGQLGLRAVDPGNYVTPGDANGIVTITQVAPISVLFALPEVDLPLVLPELRDGRALAVQILDRAGVRELASGTLATTDNAIDSTTGTLRMRATVANGDHQLFPNQFVNVRLLVQTRRVAVAIPVAAVQRNTRGSYVWSVVEGAAHMKPVQVGIESHEVVEVVEGLAVGDSVVIDGVDRLREGATVTIGDGAKAERRERNGSADGTGAAPAEGSGAPREHRRRRDGDAEGGSGRAAGRADAGGDAAPAQPAAKP